MSKVRPDIADALIALSSQLAELEQRLDARIAEFDLRVAQVEARALAAEEAEEQVATVAEAADLGLAQRVAAMEIMLQQLWERVGMPRKWDATIRRTG